MSKKIFIFNIVYYAFIIALIIQGQNHPSSSLGYGYFIIAFWAIALIALVVLIIRKIIYPKSLLDKIGIFTATPVLSIIWFSIILTLSENLSSEWYFNKNNYRYKVRMFENDKISGGKRIEYYRSIDTLVSKDIWVKDSTWIYLSKTGDTVKTIKYRNDLEVK